MAGVMQSQVPMLLYANVQHLLTRPSNLRGAGISLIPHQLIAAKVVSVIRPYSLWFSRSFCSRFLLINPLGAHYVKTVFGAPRIPGGSGLKAVK
jgi:hypothetical protein